MYKDQPIRLSPKQIQIRILKRKKDRTSRARGAFLGSCGGKLFYANCITDQNGVTLVK